MGAPRLISVSESKLKTAAAPLMKKIRMIVPRVAPTVRRMAISLPFSFTSMIMPEMMLKAATMMIRERIKKSTFLSTLRALHIHADFLSGARELAEALQQIEPDEANGDGAEADAS